MKNISYLAYLIFLKLKKKKEVRENSFGMSGILTLAKDGRNANLKLNLFLYYSFVCIDQEKIRSNTLCKNLVELVQCNCAKIHGSESG